MATLQEIRAVVHRAIPNFPSARPESRRPEDEINLARKELEAIAKEDPDLVVQTILTLPQFEIEGFSNILASMGVPAVEQLLAYVQDEDRKMTSHLVRVMGVIGDERFVDLIVDELMAIISSPFRQAQIRQKTHIHIQALKQCDAQKALDRLAPRLEDDSIDSHLRYCLRYVVNQLKK